MSRFIPEGKSNLKNLEASEKVASEKFQNEIEEKESLSLYDQMKLNYIAKEKEFEEKVKSKNQSHLIDQRELKFYNELEQEKEEKEIAKRREIEEGLRVFENLKRQRTQDTKTTEDTVEDIQQPKSIKIKSLGIKKKKKAIEPQIHSKQETEKPLGLDSKETTTESSLTNHQNIKPSSLVSGYSSSSDSD